MFPRFVWRPNKYRHDKALPEIWFQQATDGIWVKGVARNTPTLIEYPISSDDAARGDFAELAGKFPPPDGYYYP